MGVWNDGGGSSFFARVRTTSDIGHDDIGGDNEQEDGGDDNGHEDDYITIN